MSDNTLTELMDEFGVHVEMSDGENDTVSQILMDMLTEIHRLRNQAAERTPMPSDEALADTYETAALNKRLDFQWPYDDSEEHAAHLAGIRAVREAITAAQPLTPEIPEGWELNTLNYLIESNRYCAGIWGSGVIKWGYGPTWQEALAAAIAATGEGE